MPTDILAQLSRRQSRRSRLEELYNPSGLSPLQAYGERSRGIGGRALDAGLGALGTIGRVVDTPGRFVRSTLTGIPEASGRDVLKKFFGIRNRRGFDLSDIGSFLAEVALDPLTFVTGILGLTAKGAAAARATKLGGQAKALEAFAQTGTKAEEVRDALALLDRVNAARSALPADELAKGLPARIGAGQSSIVELGVPFTKRRLALGTGPASQAFAGGLSRVGGAIGGTAPAKFLKSLFIKPGGRDEALTTLKTLRQASITKNFGQALERLGRETADIERLAAQTGLPLDVARTRLTKTVEAGAGDPRHILERVVGRGEALADKGKAKGSRELRRLFGQVPRGTAKGLTKPRREVMKQLEQVRQLGLREGFTDDVLSELHYLTEQVKKAPLGADETRLPGLLGVLDEISRSPPKVVAKAESIKNELAEVFKREVVSGARGEGSGLRALTKEYFPRVLSKEARSWLKANGKEAQFLRFLESGAKKITTREGSQITRIEDLLEEFTALSDEFFVENKVDFKGSWFEVDPAKALSQRLLTKENAIVNARFLHAFADTFAKPAAAGAANAVPLEAFLATSTLHRYRGQALGKNPERIRKQLDVLGLGGHTIDKALVDEAFAVFPKLADKGELAKLSNAFDKATEFIKASLTRPFPSFHFRNLVSDTALSWLGDGVELSEIARAFRVASGKEPELLAEVSGLGILRGAKSAPRAQFAEQLGGLGAAAPKGKLARGFEVYTTFIEDFTRTWHYLSKVKQGLSPLEAAASVKKYLLDYSQLAPFEQQASRFILFYNWTRQVLPRLIGAAFETPNKFSLLSRATTRPGATEPTREPLPDYIRETLALPLGDTAQGDSRFLLGVGSPLEEFKKLDFSSPEGGLLGGVRQALTQVGQQLNPIVKAPLEFAAGRDFFLDKPIIEADRAPEFLKAPGLKQLFGVEEQQLPGGQKRLRGNPLALFVERNLPSARAVRELGRAADIISEVFGGDLDPKASARRQLSRLFLGVRTANLDPIDRARSAEEFLRRQAVGLQVEGKLKPVDAFFAPGKPKEPPPGIERLLGRRQGQLSKLLAPPAPPDLRDPRALELLELLREAQKRRIGLQEATR